MDLEKQKNIRFQHVSIRRRHNNFEEFTQPVVGEFETDYLEIISRKRKITDNIPGEYILDMNLISIYSYSLSLGTR